MVNKAPFAKRLKQRQIRIVSLEFNRQAKYIMKNRQMGLHNTQRCSLIHHLGLHKLIRQPKQSPHIFFQILSCIQQLLTTMMIRGYKVDFYTQLPKYTIRRLFLKPGHHRRLKIFRPNFFADGMVLEIH